MALDHILVVESIEGPAIGHCVPEAGLTVYYGGFPSTTISTVNSSSLSLADGRTVPAGQHYGAWPKVVRSNLDSIRGPNWPSGTDDTEFQGTDALSFGAQTLSKITYARANDVPTSV